MKRIVSDPTGTPGEGKTARDLSGVCQDTGPVATISQAGCSTFPVTDNNYGSLPTKSSVDTEIDSIGYDSAFSAIAGAAQSAYPDLWGKLTLLHQSSVLVDNCYCVGQGDNIAGLAIGRPRFPNIRTLPFFWVPISSSIRGGGDDSSSAPPQVLNVVTSVSYSQGTGNFTFQSVPVTVLSIGAANPATVWTTAVVCPPITPPP
jgi:hypothetical protein